MDKHIPIEDERMEGMRAIRDYAHGESLNEFLKNAIEASPQNESIYIDSLKWPQQYNDYLTEDSAKISGNKMYIANKGAMKLPEHLCFGASDKNKGFKANENHGSGAKKSGLRDNVGVVYFSYKDSMLTVASIKRKEEGDVVICRHRDKWGAFQEYHVYEGEDLDQVLNDFSLTSMADKLGNEWTIVIAMGSSYTEDCINGNMIMTATNVDYQLSKKDCRLDVYSSLVSRWLRFDNATNGNSGYKISLEKDRQTGGKKRGVRGLLETADDKDGISRFSFEVPSDPRLKQVHVIRNPYRKNSKVRYLEQITGGVRSGFASQNIIQARLNKAESHDLLRNLGINDDYSGWIVIAELTDVCEGKESRTSHLYDGEAVTFDDSMCLAIKNRMPQELCDLIESCRRENSINEKNTCEAIWDLEKKHKLDWSGNSIKKITTVNDSSHRKINLNQNSKTKPSVKQRRGIASETPFEDLSKEDAEAYEVNDKFPFAYVDEKGRGGSVKFCSGGSAWKQFVLNPIWECCGVELTSQEKANDVIIKHMLVDFWDNVFSLCKYNIPSQELSLDNNNVKESLEAKSTLGWYSRLHPHLLKKIKKELVDIQQGSKELEKV